TTGPNIDSAAQTALAAAHAAFRTSAVVKIRNRFMMYPRMGLRSRGSHCGVAEGYCRRRARTIVTAAFGDGCSAGYGAGDGEDHDQPCVAFPGLYIELSNVGQRSAALKRRANPDLVRPGNRVRMKSIKDGKAIPICGHCHGRRSAGELPARTCRRRRKRDHRASDGTPILFNSHDKRLRRDLLDQVSSALALQDEDLQPCLRRQLLGGDGLQNELLT